MAEEHPAETVDLHHGLLGNVASRSSPAGPCRSTSHAFLGVASGAGSSSARSAFPRTYTAGNSSESSSASVSSGCGPQVRSPQCTSRSRRQPPRLVQHGGQGDRVAVHVGEHDHPPVRDFRTGHRVRRAAAVALELRPLGVDHLGRAFATNLSFASMRSARATSPRSRSISAAALPFTGARSGRTTAAKMRRSSSEPSSTWTPLHRKSAPPPGRGRARPRRRPARRHRATPPRSGAPSWNCDQISSVTCGITGWRIASRARARQCRRAARPRPVVQPRLDRLGVPVAEVVERDVVEAIGRIGEVERCKRSSSPRRVRPAGRGSSAPRRPAAARRGACRRRAGGSAAPRSRACSRASAPPRSSPGEADVLGRAHLQGPVAGRVAPCRSTESSGSRPVPRLFDIRRPSARGSSR